MSALARKERAAVVGWLGSIGYGDLGERIERREHLPPQPEPTEWR